MALVAEVKTHSKQRGVYLQCLTALEVAYSQIQAQSWALRVTQQENLKWRHSKMSFGNLLGTILIALTTRFRPMRNPSFGILSRKELVGWGRHLRHLK